MIENFYLLKKVIREEIGTHADPLLSFGITKDLDYLSKYPLHTKKLKLSYYIKTLDILLELEVLHNGYSIRVSKIIIRYPNGEIKEREV